MSFCALPTPSPGVIDSRRYPASLRLQTKVSPFNTGWQSYNRFQNNRTFLNFPILYKCNFSLDFGIFYFFFKFSFYFYF